MIFDQWIFLLLPIMLGGLVSDHITFHLSEKFPRKCASVDLQYKYFPLKLPKPYHVEIF